MTGHDKRLGVWFLGARGSVATTATLGLRAVLVGQAPTTGLVTETAPFATADLPPLSSLVVGGHDLAGEPLEQRASRLAADGVVPYWLPASQAAWLHEADARVRPGVDDAACADDPATALERVRADLAAFREEQRLSDVVVVQLISTEPLADPAVLALDQLGLAAALDGNGPSLPASVVYAAAALEEGCAFVDFTPSVATLVPGVRALATERGLPLGGRDGKTGETLVKSALAPLFADRALRVRSWAGSNLLGGGDGAALADPDRRAAKLASKDGPLRALLGDDVETRTSIEHVADFGEWKTAWDHVAFEGFLGTRMQLQFTWQGCDSALAAPLVLDLARLAGLALRTGRSGPVGEWGYFFKDPVGTSEHRLSQQFEMLCGWVTRASERLRDTP